ncbi:MAG: Ig-like domain-containing protein [Rhodanobacteraceae bacterium]|nr:Ig-like domain-containing protein [Rhodanobacteraceae bacterium]
MFRSLAIALVAACALLGAPQLDAQVLPPVVPGFANVPQTPGTLLSPLMAPNQGRTSILAYHNGILYSVPESPDSLAGSDLQVRSWSLTDPSSPQETAQLGITRQPINAHGYYQRNADLVLGDTFNGLSWTFRAGAPGVNQRMAFPGFQCAGERGCLFYPHFVTPTLWSYGPLDGTVSLQRLGQTLASWNLLSETGVVGHPFIIGNRLYFASDMTRTGVASYDISDPMQPVLLDVLTAGGPGGYWPEIFGLDDRLYLVFPYRTNGNGFRLVDITDPTDLAFIGDYPLPGAEAMYAQFQDEYAFIGDHKIDLRTRQSVLYLDGAHRPRPGGGVGVDTSQFALPLGNLLITGGSGEHQGMAVWAHQAEPDTRGPSVGFHVPTDGQTGYPLEAPITLLIHETLESKTIVPSVSLIVRPLSGAALAGQVTFSFDDVLTFTPDAPLTPNTTYEVLVVAGGIKDAAGNGIEGLRFVFSTGAHVTADEAPVIDAFNAAGSPALVGASIEFTVAAHDPEGQALEYRFDAGDGSPRSDWTTQTLYPHGYAAPGHFRAIIQSRDPGGRLASASRTVTVLSAFPAPAPASAAPLACLDDGSVAVVNPDNDSVARIASDGSNVLAERQNVCADPRSVSAVGADRLWVSCHDDDRIVILRRSDLLPQGEIVLSHGSRPHDLVATANGAQVYVSAYGRGELLRFNANTLAPSGTLALGPGSRALALGADGNRIYVSRFLSPRDHAEIWEVDTGTLTLQRTLRLPKFGGMANRDSTASGRGVANFLSDLAVSPGGQSLWLAATKPNVERGTLIGPDLDTDNTQRTVVAEISLGSGQLLRAIDVDNSDSAHALAFSPLGDYLYVALQGNDQLAVYDLLEQQTAQASGALRARLSTGGAPQGVCVSGNAVWSQNLLGRSVNRFDASQLYAAGEPLLPGVERNSASVELLPAQVLAGKRIFYRASDPRMSSEGYLSCASCHLDGDQDGRIWDFSGRGEGLRNTISLRGRAGMGHGKVHWSANFDEIQDFENDIRLAFGGSGFLTNPQFAATSDPLGAPKAGLNADLDALAAYVASLGAEHLPASAWRNADGSVSAQAQVGQGVFETLGCASCHTPPRYTRSPLAGLDLVNVGTLRDTSGHRLGGVLPGIDIPTLLDLPNTAPYLHDGSAVTLEAVFSATGGTVVPAESGTPTLGAYIENQYVDLNYDDTVRGRALVFLGDQGSRLSFSNVDGGVGGIGAIELRYSSAASSVELRVNGVAYPVNLANVGNPTFAQVNWRTARIDGVALQAGPNNSVVIERTAPFALVALDEMTISRPDELNLAQPHRAVLALSANDREALMRFLLELESSAVPMLDAIFGDDFEG